MGCECDEEKIGKQFSEAGEWVSASYVMVASGTSLTQSADQWLDCRAWQDLFLLVEFQGSNGTNLTVKLQTAAALSTDNSAWTNVTGGAVTMSTSAAVIEAGYQLAVPPMGVVRLVYSSSGATVTGMVRVLVVRKQAA